MSIKSVLYVLSGNDVANTALDKAFSLASSYAAVLTVLYILPSPSSYAGIYGEGVISSARIIEAMEKENRKSLDVARECVEACAKRHNIELGGKKIKGKFSVRFLHILGNAEEIVADYGRINDIIVMGRGGKELNALYDDVVISALFNTGRAVLLIPSVKEDNKNNDSVLHCQFKKVAIAWDGGLEAARAVYNALHFIENAQEIYLLSAHDEDEKQDLEAEKGIIEYLRLYNDKVSGVLVASGSRIRAEALLIRAKELKADLLVMGAYGHSRLREMILGGVTDYMLENGDMPLLLSH